MNQPGNNLVQLIFCGNHIDWGFDTESIQGPKNRRYKNYHTSFSFFCTRPLLF